MTIPTTTTAAAAQTMHAADMAHIITGLLHSATYLYSPIDRSNRIDTAITILEAIGYTYHSSVTGYMTAEDSGTAYGISGHTNGNTYTMVCPFFSYFPVIYLCRENGRVSA